MRVQLSWLIFLLGVLQTSAAFACGVWDLRDDERGQRVRFYIRSTYLHTREAEDAEPRRILLMEGDSAEQLHTEVGGRTQLAVVDDQLRLGGKTVGTLHGDELTVGRAVYRITVTLNPDGGLLAVRHENRWLVEVHRGEQLVAHGRAMTMCLGGLKVSTDQVQILEVQRRVTYYLAWRELLARRPTAKPPAPTVR